MCAAKLFYNQGRVPRMKKVEKHCNRQRKTERQHHHKEQGKDGQRWTKQKDNVKERQINRQIQKETRESLGYNKQQQIKESLREKRGECNRQMYTKKVGIGIDRTDKKKNRERRQSVAVVTSTVFLCKKKLTSHPDAISGQ